MPKQANRNRERTDVPAQTPLAVAGQARVRAKHQVTLPHAVARELGIEAGDRLLFDVDAERGEARIRIARRSYAGTLADVYSDAAGNAGYLAEERGAWKQTAEEE